MNHVVQMSVTSSWFFFFSENVKLIISTNHWWNHNMIYSTNLCSPIFDNGRLCGKTALKRLRVVQQRCPGLQIIMFFRCKKKVLGVYYVFLNLMLVGPPRFAWRQVLLISTPQCSWWFPIVASTRENCLPLPAKRVRLTHKHPCARFKRVFLSAMYL